MSTSSIVKFRFPVNSRVRTTTKSNLLRGQTERFATVRGYCDQSGHDAYIRVTWDGWKSASTTQVNSTTLEPVTKVETSASTKTYLLVEVDSRDETMSQEHVQEVVAEMLRPEDGQDIHVRVFRLTDQLFSGRAGTDLYQSDEIINGIEPQAFSASVVFESGS